ncbi:MAG: SPOR domain-containing protein [Novosphingobium sp.]|nr:SPOR domain-containing protein [Novosphingobium sp.]
MFDRHFQVGLRTGAACVLAVSLVAAGSPLLAQSGPAVAHEVVQPLPPPGAEALNAALQKLATNPRDAGALTDAGFAALDIGDVDAAVGFFSRADAVDPGNARAQAGLGAAYVRSENPYDALLRFEEAEKAGAMPASLAGDRGLAYDLVGDNASAQQFYRQALAYKPDDNVIRRLAVSLAISGDKAGAEAALLPLLKKRDLAAYRTRAFVLAIMGDAKGAQEITDRVMPTAMAARIAPYLRYMPRLTPAQQAAAANFGQFPTASDIGKDDPRIAKYSGNSQRARYADGGQSALAAADPGGSSGKPVRESKRKNKRTEPATVAMADAPPLPQRAAPVSDEGELPPLSQGSAAPAAPRPSLSVGTPAEAPRPSLSVSKPPASHSGEVAIASFGSTQAPVAAAPSPVIWAPPQPSAAPLDKPVPVPVPASTAASVQQPAAAPVPAAPAFRPPAPEPQAPAPQSAPQQRIVDVFADFAKPAAPASRVSGAVDITKITPRRETPPPKEEPKPKPPAHPSRNWVQVATGRDIKALGFDWRRISRSAADVLKGKQAYTAQWGRTNRLVTGPFPSASAAQDFVTALKKAGIDAFTFTSDEGEEVTPLKSGR